MEEVEAEGDGDVVLLGCDGRRNVLESALIVGRAGRVCAAVDGARRGFGGYELRPGGQMPCPPHVGDFSTKRVTRRVRVLEIRAWRKEIEKREQYF